MMLRTDMTGAAAEGAPYSPGVECHRHFPFVFCQVLQALWPGILKGQLPQVNVCLPGH